MFDYEEEREYVRELYWESKGMGRTPSIATSLTDSEYIPAVACTKCNRIGTAKAVALHQERYPDCDK